MATLEAIRGGGGSIRVGTVGTISSLMTRELESTAASSQRLSSPRYNDNGSLKPRKSVDEASSSSGKHRNPDVVHKTKSQKSHHATVLSVTTPKRPKQKTLLEDVSINTVGHAVSKKVPSSSGKTRSHRTNSQIPMLGSENMHLEKTPIRVMPMKKGLNIVDIVDVGCGSPSLSDRLKKLGFSKLSQSFM